MTERTAKEKVVDAIYAAWGAGKFNDPEVRDAEIAKYFTEDAYFKTSAPQVHGAASPFGLQPTSLPISLQPDSTRLPARSTDACALWRNFAGQGARRQSVVEPGKTR